MILSADLALTNGAFLRVLPQPLVDACLVEDVPTGQMGELLPFLVLDLTYRARALGIFALLERRRTEAVNDALRGVYPEKGNGSRDLDSIRSEALTGENNILTLIGQTFLTGKTVLKTVSSPSLPDILQLLETLVGHIQCRSSVGIQNQRRTVQPPERVVEVLHPQTPEGGMYPAVSAATSAARCCQGGGESETSGEAVDEDHRSSEASCAFPQRHQPTAHEATTMGAFVSFLGGSSLPTEATPQKNPRQTLGRRHRARLLRGNGASSGCVGGGGRSLLRACVLEGH